MASPSLALQGAVVAALKAATPVSALVGARVYDSVPASSPFPYISLGDGTMTLDEGQDYEGENVAFTVHAWSRATGFPEAKNLAWAIKQTLHGAELTVLGYHLVIIALVDDTTFRDPDGLTSHAALNFRAELEPTS
ncbi:MAG: hypothetical protein JWQ03_3237 [Variovorax sp.]|nr:hypothetical protein [Variovorax sp.]